MLMTKVKNNKNIELTCSIGDMEKEWRESLPRLTDKEWLEIFPEAKNTIRQKTADFKKLKGQLFNLIGKKMAWIKKNVSPENQWFWRELIKAIDAKELLKVEKDLLRFRRMVSETNEADRRNWVGEKEINMALAVPIETLISQPLIKRGHTLVGLCPLHDEKTPSFHVYPETNSCWCYGCNQGGNTINLMMLLHGYSFQEAVRSLIN